MTAAHPTLTTVGCSADVALGRSRRALAHLRMLTAGTCVAEGSPVRLFDRPGRIVQRVGNALPDVSGEIVVRRVRAATEPLGSGGADADAEAPDSRRERATTEPLSPIAGGTPPLGVRIDAALVDADYQAG